MGAAILMVAALAVAYLTKGTHVPKLDSLKACQDINEEIFAQISALGNGDFSFVYGTDSVDDLARYCPPNVCDEGGLGLSPSVRWPSNRLLTTPTNPPLVRPHLLRVSSINYLLALYKSANFCSDFASLPEGDFDIFKRTYKNNLLQARLRDGSTRIRIQAIRPGANLFCPNRNGLEIRPSSVQFGHEPPVLRNGIVVNEAATTDFAIGFKVTLATNYVDALNPNQPQTCFTEKEYYYQPENYLGQMVESWIVAPHEPAWPIVKSTLPACSAPTTVTFTKRYEKVKKDSVLLCRDRSQIGQWMNNAPCDLSNPIGDKCECSVGNGCQNTWATFTPSDEPDASLIDPLPTSNPWFPCDQLPSRLVAANIVDNANQVRVDFKREGNGALEIQVLDLKNEVPIKLPKRVRVDVIEVDSALNSSADRPSTPVAGAELATLKVNFFGNDPGNVCEICGVSPTAYEFRCGACPSCCDPTSECCDGDSWPSNPNCGCTDPDPCVCNPEICETNDCDNWATQGYSSKICCETNDSDPSCGTPCNPSTDCCGQTNPPNLNCPATPPTSCTDACAEGATQILSVPPVCQGTQLVTSELRSCVRGANGCTDWISQDISDACLCPPGQTVGCSGGSCNCTP